MLCVPCPLAAGRIPRLQPSLLAALTSDLNTTSSRLLGLRELLPDANVSALVAARPQLLLQDTAEVQSSVTALQRLLGVEHVDRCVWAVQFAGMHAAWTGTAESRNGTPATTAAVVSCMSVCRLVEVQPLFLVTECVEQVLGEIQRLMPNANAAALLVSDPDWLLRVQRGQQWLGLHPDSQLGEQVDWKPPEGSS